MYVYFTKLLLRCSHLTALLFTHRCQSCAAWWESWAGGRPRRRPRQVWWPPTSGPCGQSCGWCSACQTLRGTFSFIRWPRHFGCTRASIYSRRPLQCDSSRPLCAINGSTSKTYWVFNTLFEREQLITWLAGRLNERTSPVCFIVSR